MKIDVENATKEKNGTTQSANIVPEATVSAATKSENIPTKIDTENATNEKIAVAPGACDSKSAEHEKAASSIDVKDDAEKPETADKPSITMSNTSVTTSTTATNGPVPCTPPNQPSLGASSPSSNISANNALVAQGPILQSPTTPIHHSTSSSLYVGDLHQNTTENSLYEIFQAVGPVQSIRVCRDVVSRRSLGYAYINFHKSDDARRAMRDMNYYANVLTHNIPMRIMWKTRDPSVRKSGVGNIFVKSLNKTIDSKMLYDTFIQFGNILSCKVATNEIGESLGYGFVHFETAEFAADAIKKVNGMLLDNRKVYVGRFLRRGEREAAGEITKPFTNIYIKNIGVALLSNEALRSMFSHFGRITSVHVARDGDGKLKGFAFVNFAEHEMAKRCVEEMHGKEINGRSIFVNRAQKRHERNKMLHLRHEQLRNERAQKYHGANLYVKNLGDGIDEDRLRQEFSEFGTITSCKVMKTATNASRGFGFVCFSTPDEATKAVMNLNGRIIGHKPIYIALAQRRDVRRAQLAAQHSNSMQMQGSVYQSGAMYRYTQPGSYLYNSQAAMVQVSRGMAEGRSTYNRAQMIQMNRNVTAANGVPVHPTYMHRLQPQQNMVHNMNREMMQSYAMAVQRGERYGRSRVVPQRPINQAGAQANMNGGPGNRGGVQDSSQGGQQLHRSTQAVSSTQERAISSTQVSDDMHQVVANVTSESQENEDNAEKVNTQAAGGTTPLTIEMLTNASPSKQKQMLGERLYPLIAKKKPSLAGKITGMLLEMENRDILHLLESPEALDEHIEEGITVLRNHAAGNQEGNNSEE